MRKKILNLIFSLKNDRNYQKTNDQQKCENKVLVQIYTEKTTEVGKVIILKSESKLNLLILRP